jgi:hypothetical protein
MRETARSAALVPWRHVWPVSELRRHRIEERGIDIHSAGGIQIGMRSMRQWLDAKRIDPSAFVYQPADAIAMVEFQLAKEADAFGSSAAIRVLAERTARIRPICHPSQRAILAVRRNMPVRRRRRRRQTPVGEQAWREIADACDKLANIVEQSETAVAG